METARDIKRIHNNISYNKLKLKFHSKVTAVGGYLGFLDSVAVFTVQGEQFLLINDRTHNIVAFSCKKNLDLYVVKRYNLWLTHLIFVLSILSNCLLSMCSLIIFTLLLVSVCCQTREKVRIRNYLNLCAQSMPKEDLYYFLSKLLLILKWLNIFFVDFFHGFFSYMGKDFFDCQQRT